MVANATFLFYEIFLPTFIEYECEIYRKKELCMWLVYALASSFFAGITAILAKVGIREVDSSLATALRTIVVLFFTWLMVLITGAYTTISNLTIQTLIFLVLSGLATGASWLCYFKALQIGDVNKVTPIDKLSTVLTMILAVIFFQESITFIKVICIILITIGTYLMIEKKESNHQTTDNQWMIYAFGSAIFASLTSILGKIGVSTIDSHLGTAIRTIVVLIMAWLIVFKQGQQTKIKDIHSKSWLFLILSGMTTGFSWLCYYRALQLGPASIVVPIDKLSIVITIAFSYLILKEKISYRSFIGLVILVIGTLLLLL